jgi:hypothetical protein
MERAERSGGLHKRSAEAWGDFLPERGAELPLAGLGVGCSETGYGPSRDSLNNFQVLFSLKGCPEGTFLFAGWNAVCVSNLQVRTRF